MCLRPDIDLLMLRGDHLEFSSLQQDETMKQICVYCGSRPGRLKDYQQVAKELGQIMAQQGIGLVYGGASIGIMGLLADEVLAHGGRVTGVIPQVLVAKEVAHPNLSELRVVKSMHERKATMAELADGFIALPGGLGTLEELFEMLTWGVLGIHQKPCALLNTAGYYDLLIAFLQHARDEQFINPAHHELLLSDHDPYRLLTRMKDQAPVAEPRLLTADES